MKEPTAPTKEGFDFVGWYTDKELKTKYDFSAKVFGQTKSNDVDPKIVNDRTMLPARFVAESLGAVVT